MGTWALALTVATCIQVAARADEPSADDAAFFESQIRPLLIARCYQCHGDVKEPKGGLTLTSREAVMRGGESGPAAVPGKPSESPLIAAVNYEGLEMPPEGDRLSAVEVARLETWVARGLPWPKDEPAALARAQALAENEQIAHARQRHWAFRPVTRPMPPKVQRAAWPQNDLDRFVLAEQEKRGLSPSPPADKRTLLRRLSFDLIGLPPTPEELAAFEADNSREAVARQVDRLLASPHYGERWGRHWLDVTRYADTKGYVLFQDDKFPWSYTYRDYVVRSLNEDLPYDRFIVEQLAADQLPLGDDQRALAALGFLTLGNGFMNNQQDVLDDRIDVVTRGLLGLTVSCARCHDHKFDPIPTSDYYSLYGVFASSSEPTVPPLFEEPPKTEAYEAFAKELAERERKLAEYVDGKYRALADSARAQVAEYLLAAESLRGKPTTEDFMLLSDTNDLNPTMILRYQVYLERTRATNDPVWTVWHALSTLGDDEFAEQAQPTMRNLVSGQDANKSVHPLVAGAFLGKPLKERADAARIYAELLFGVDSIWQARLCEAASSGQAAPMALNDESLESLRQVFYGADAPANFKRADIGVLALLPDRESQGVRSKLLKAVEEWRATGPAAPPRAMVLEDLPTAIRPRVFVRGNPNQLGAEVPRRFLRVLSTGQPRPFEHGSGRLELARAIADPANPLTARVLVNRVWQRYFGKPLVSTPSDFGLRSDPPTNPQLLDCLATTLVDGNWSLKLLHRTIVLSATYQQASDDQADARAIDPQNEWLWRMNRRRLDFEATRDALLAVSGRLDPKLGGPPAGSVADAAGTRRTLYGFIDRLNLPGIFRTFDFPTPDATSPERVMTTIPQQALFFMNGPLVKESARQLAGRAATGDGDDDGRIRRLFAQALTRLPSAEEFDWARQFISSRGSQAASWEELAQALLVTNEFVFLD